MPIFHRECNGTTQTLETMIKQINSGEIWGRPKHQGNGLLSVAAFPHPLPDGVDGIEFETDVECDSPGTPKAVWSLDLCPAVELFVGSDGSEMCRMKVKFTRIVCTRPDNLTGVSCNL